MVIQETLAPARVLSGLFQRRSKGAENEPATDELGHIELIHNPEVGESIIDVVAVHGLARGFKSWTWSAGTRKRQTWLEAGLAKDKCGQSLRIMSYSYDPDLFRSEAYAGMVLYSRSHDLVHDLVRYRQKTGTMTRPIVFIAHSLGGLIVKRALIFSSESIDQGLRSIEISTGGVVYLGTPDDDSPPESLAATIRKISLLEPNNETKATPLKDPSPIQDARWLTDELQAYKPIRSEIKVLEIYETKRTSFRGHKEFIVSEPNTLNTSSDRIRLPLERNHTGLVKFQGDDDPCFQKFMRVFRKLLSEWSERASVKLQRHNLTDALLEDNALSYLQNDFDIQPTHPVPHTRLVTRTWLADELERLLQSSISTDDFNMVTIHGLPGVGKTTLARDYCENVGSKMNFCFWINAESRETIIASYLELLRIIVEYHGEKRYSRDLSDPISDPKEARKRVERDLGIPDIKDMLKEHCLKQLEPVDIQSAVKGAKDWLLRENNKWVLVFDNVRGNYNLLDFIPFSCHGRMIFISEDRAACPWGKELRMPAWCEEDAMELFREMSGIAYPTPVPSDTGGETERMCRDIVKQLNFLPQAIVCAAVRVRTARQTLYGYLNALQNPESSLQGLQSPLGTELLQVCSLLSPKALPFKLLYKVAQEICFSDTGGGILNIQKTHPDKVITVLATFEELNIMLRIPQSESGTKLSSEQHVSSADQFLLHQNVREWVRSTWMTSRQTKVHSAWLACFCCVRLIRLQESTRGLRDIQTAERMILPHAKACFELSDVLKDNSEKLLEIEWHVLGGLFMRQGEGREAIDCFALALQNPGRMTPVEQTETILSMASVYQQQDNLIECRRLLKDLQVNDIIRQDRRLGRRVELAKAYSAAANGEMEMARTHYISLEGYQEEDFGTVDTRTIHTVHQMAVTMKSLGKLSNALALYRQVFLSYVKLLGINNPVTLDAAEELAQIFQLRGTFENAEDIFNLTISVKRKTLGPHPSTAISIAKGAALCDLKGDFEGADTKYQEAFDIMSRALGRSHPMFLAAKENHALSYRKRAHRLYTREKLSASDVQKCETDYQRAEIMYGEIIEEKERSKNLYTEEDILSTRMKRSKMYETEAFFRDRMGQKRLPYPEADSSH
ncbi:hypothetical protein F5X99DRAFT_368781 [Biscogniauxia marginata]|nr:hypothetical protein F5X99DRAFT_368781 [Biscogniauxia marginata]